MNHFKKTGLIFLLTALVILSQLVGLRAAEIYINPNIVSADVGELVTVMVQLDSVTDLGGFQLDFTYNPLILDVIGPIRVNQDFDQQFKKEFDNATGKGIVASFVIDNPPLTGNNLILVTLDFLLKSGGESDIGLSHVILGQIGGVEIPSTIVNGKVVVISSPEDTDDDGDGWTENQGDCNDFNPDVNPGAIEACNNINDDCDGEVDEEDADGCSVFYKDQDEDGYGADGDSRCLCASEGSYTATQGGDVDDRDPNISVKYILNLPAGWSMISVPVKTHSTAVNDLFPDAVVVYGYNKGIGYERSEEIEVGRGYWILFNEEQSYILTGHPIKMYTKIVEKDGWEIIGGCTYPAKPSTDSCSIGVIYRYVQEAGYKRVFELGTLEPGGGYWILFDDIMDQCEFSVVGIVP